VIIKRIERGINIQVMLGMEKKVELPMSPIPHKQMRGV
jgi:hypothetical protein